MIENDGAAVSRFLESAYWGCMSQCHHSNVSPGLITSTPVSEANNQFLPVMWFFQCFFTSRRVSAPHQLPRKSGKHILFNFVFWSPLWASKTTFSLIEIVRDWSVSGTCLFYWPNVLLLFYLLVFILYTYLAQKLHEMNTSCTKFPPILCHCCLLYLLACYTMPCGPIVPNPASHMKMT